MSDKAPADDFADEFSITEPRGPLPQAASPTRKEELAVLGTRRKAEMETSHISLNVPRSRMKNSTKRGSLHQSGRQADVGLENLPAFERPQEHAESTMDNDVLEDEETRNNEGQNAQDNEGDEYNEEEVVTPGAFAVFPMGTQASEQDVVTEYGASQRDLETGPENREEILVSATVVPDEGREEQPVVQLPLTNATVVRRGRIVFGVSVLLLVTVVAVVLAVFFATQGGGGEGGDIPVTTVMTNTPSFILSSLPSVAPSPQPSRVLSQSPTASVSPSQLPTIFPSPIPSPRPSVSVFPSTMPTHIPSGIPSFQPTKSVSPSASPSLSAVPSGTLFPTTVPSSSPSSFPTTLTPSIAANIVPGVATQWVQVGQIVEGDGTNNLFAQSLSVSSDGSIVAAGAPRFGFYDDGHVRVFRLVGDSWMQIGSDIRGEVDGDRFGLSVALSGDGMIVAGGAASNDNVGSNSGHVRVFAFNGTDWEQIGQNIHAEAAGDAFGTSVALSKSGQILAVGAPDNNAGVPFSAQGHVRVFEFNGTDWMQLGQDIDGVVRFDGVGSAISLSADGHIVAVGASSHNGNGIDDGHVRVFTFDGQEWVQMGNDLVGSEPSDGLGHSVALSARGNVLVAGAWQWGAPDDPPGYAQVYSFDGSQWSLVGSRLVGIGPDDWFGVSVSISDDGTIVAVAATENDNSFGTNAGQVQIFGYNGTDWTQLGQDIRGTALFDRFGVSLALSADGSRCSIGSPAIGTNVGAFRVFDAQQ